LPGLAEREQIWRVQVHPTLTPLAADVDFGALAAYEASGGDIRNAVLKAALAAASEPGPDAAKVIHQRHLETGIQDVLAAKSVMQQSLLPVLAAELPRHLTGPTRDTVLAFAALLVALTALIVALVR
jgi:hypothetical protein